ncbi:MAG: hypothetical protein ABI651_12840 [Verrucomicrobiota bacterium]
MNKETKAGTVLSALASLVAAMAMQCLGATPEIGVTIGTGIYVTLGAGNQILTSRDGIQWSH